ncbi:hypothetical protein PV327_002914 [Microctonus hyperodae]|uniref:Cytochrome P450 n=1 Tax=Microctonus hyperodae TaxID=165561 RepID=A0AA39G3D3_MICHY|nr:hypothetical protein PV327_002914 [Microctonus hyperodae]
MIDNIFNGYGPKMRAHRKLLMPLINGQHLRNYIETFNKEACRYIDALSIKTDSDVFDIYNETQYCLADITFETLLGISGVAQNTGVLTVPHAMETKPGRAFKSATTTIHEFISKIINEKKSLYMALERGESKVEKPKPSIVDLLIENVIVTHAMDDQEILYDIIALLFGIIMKSTKSQKKSYAHDFMKPLVIDSIINGYGPKMRAHRKLLVPLVNGKPLTNYIKTFNDAVCRYIDALSVKTESEVFDIYNETQYCLADMSFETILGISGVAQSTGDLTIPHAMETKGGKTYKSTTTIMHEFISKIIDEKKSLYMALERGESKAEKPKPSILDLLIENVLVTHAMDDREILYDMIALFFGFYDTILGVFSFTILMLAMHPDVQNRIREEVLSIIGASDNVMLDNIGSFEYMDMVIKETIRLFPVGPIIPREITDDLQIAQVNLLVISFIAND